MTNDYAHLLRLAEAGDVVTEVNGKPVRDANHLRLEVARVRPGETASLRVRRDNETKVVKVTVRERPEDQDLAKSSKSRSGEDDSTLNGVGVVDLTPQNRRQYRVPERVKGVLVTEVEDGSPAWEAGLRPGDVILELNKKAVASADETVRLTTNPKDRTTLLKVYTPSAPNGAGGGTRFLVVDETSAE